MTTFEQRELRGVTIKNIMVTILSTASIVASVMTCYFQLKSDIHDLTTRQEAQNRVNEIRLKVLEGQVAVLQREVEAIKTNKY
ncbi:hypothetical protein A0256_22145 [Mucilaginibacter sp. PAMC 26640]|nr:hypothetical protein A0256_22145 [Mucilaginibacter sp. PAMC 26640]